MKRSYHSYWGKAEREGREYHLLPYHCLDVAAVLDELLKKDAILRKKIEALSPIPLNQTIPLLIFFTALHDIGKFSLPFQNKRPDISAELGIPSYRLECTVHHTVHGWWLYKKQLFSILAATQEIPLEKEHKQALTPLVSAVMGHHGIPVDGSTAGSRAHFKGTLEHATDFAHDAARMFLPENLTLPTDEEAFRSLSWLISGICVIADWIGSNSDWFPLCQNPMPLREYWENKALPAAGRAIAECGLLAPETILERDFNTILPHLPSAATPSPLQAYALHEAVRTTGPQLHIFEDLTGGGKTEAAILASHGLMVQGDGSGLYIGLPTMATANAMYTRLADSYRALFSPSSHPSLMLAHGAKHINHQYISSIPLESVQPGEEQDGEPFCASWLADNRKKALLAPCGAGTLDQALLAVLPVRHQCLRLAGLARSVLIADEVHAYDTYTTELLCALLSFHAALGGSAILLSATMPMELRARLTANFAAGAGYDTPEPDNDHFPLATRIDRLGMEETPVSSTRSVSASVILTDDEAVIHTRLLDVRRAGGCAIWVRNTVDQAKAAYDILTREHKFPAEDVLLFHARFTLADRRKIEAETLRLFGKKSIKTERAGKILIATQVVEQSLDLDADFLASDLAPMELLLQRLGREHRHSRDWRPEGFEEPSMYILSPDPTSKATADWYEKVLGKAKYVYPRPAVLWRTARLLRECGRIDLIPDESGNISEARRFIEQAYGDLVAPEALEDAEYEVLGKDMAEKALALGNILPLEQGYTHTETWYEDTVTPTRLGEETVQVRLIKVEGETCSLWGGKGTAPLTCALSEVRVPLRQIGEPVIDPDLEKQLDEFRENMPDKGRWCRVIPLRYDGVRWWCEMREGKGRLIYHPEFGLEINKD